MKKNIILLASLFGGLALIQILLIIRAGASANETPSKQQKALMSERISVQAARRGNPWINLSDGRDLTTAYTGAEGLNQVLEQNQARPLALASADFDEDGVADLVSAYAGPRGGILTLHRGNVDSIFPNTPEARQRRGDGETRGQEDSESAPPPFLSPARAFEALEAPELLGTGDFDNDGHQDVVAAALTSNALSLLSGDGRGGLGKAQRIELPGRVTALVTGEINRADGLPDVVVGITSAEGPRVLVFESPEGALRSEPEVFTLAAEASALALGQLDSDYPMDLAVAAGHDLLIVQGRDRKLSLDEIRRAAVPEPIVTERSLPFEVRFMAIGDFSADQRMELALVSDEGAMHLLAQRRRKAKGIGDWGIETLTAAHWPLATALVSAKVSTHPKDDLVVVDRAGSQLHILTGDAETGRGGERASITASAGVGVSASLDVEGGTVAVLPMRLNPDALNDLVILRSGHSAPAVAVTATAATFTVNSAGDGGDSNLADGVCNDGSGGCTLRAAIEQANASPDLDTININVPCIDVPPLSSCDFPQIKPNSPLPEITRPVTIDGTGQRRNGVVVGRVMLNGVNAGMFATGLVIIGGSSTVRGLVIGNFEGIAIELKSLSPQSGGGNKIEGNYIGTNFTGTAAAGNSARNTGGALYVNGCPNNTIGGTLEAARNVISGNDYFSIRINEGAGNKVQGNYVGTDVTGTVALPNAAELAADAPGTVVGGTTAAARNVISGRGMRAGTGVQVQGNFIGTNKDGTAPLGGNSAGVFADGSIIGGTAGTTPGGPCTGACNVISGNRIGVIIDGATTQVQGNYIGTDVSGTLDLGNSGSGVAIDGDNNVIGGTIPGARNVISGNDEEGVRIDRNTNVRGDNLVQGNFIGTKANGAEALCNSGAGVHTGVSVKSTVGGTTAGSGNVISGNDIGVLIDQSRLDIRVQGNFIGTDATGTVSLGNKQGVRIVDGRNNTIGGTEPASRNIISGNDEVGVEIFGSVFGRARDNKVQGNYIGTKVNGTEPLGNGSVGVLIHSTLDNTIGGAVAGARNTISANAIGVHVAGAGAIENTVQGNYIGTDASGTADLGNATEGVFVEFSDGNIIGGAAAGEGNLISGNNTSGIRITGFLNFGKNNKVQGNLIGTKANGRDALPNSGHGIYISEASSNTIGSGITSAGGNTIAFNGGDGIFIEPLNTSATGNAILLNSIFSNTGLGIDLFPDGVTANDAADADPGANNLQNFPVLSSANSTASSVTIQGTLNSTANTAFRLEFFSNTACDPSGSGEGQSLIGTTMVTTDANGNASFNVTFPTQVAGGQLITATATDPNENTSEFSRCVQVVGPPKADFSLAFDQPTLNVERGTNVRVTVSINRTGGFSGNVTVTPPDASALKIKVKPPDPVTTTDASASFKLKIKAGAPPGPQQLVFTGSDDTGRAASATVTLVVQ